MEIHANWATVSCCSKESLLHLCDQKESYFDDLNCKTTFHKSLQKGRASRGQEKLVIFQDYQSSLGVQWVMTEREKKLLNHFRANKIYGLSNSFSFKKIIDLGKYMG